MASRLRVLRTTAENAGDYERADALTASLRTHLAEQRAAADAAAPAADVIDIEAARKRRGNS